MVKTISPDVVLVTGIASNAIFDFRRKGFVRVDDNTIDLIMQATNGEELTDEEREIIEQLKSSLMISELCFEDYMFPEPEPLRVRFAQLEITRRCMYNCLHCYEGGLSHQEVESPLSYSKWIELIDELGDLGCERLQFIGGEPTLYKRLPELIAYAYGRGFRRIEVFSNLFNVSDELMDCMKNYNVTVRTSIYGSTEFPHDTITSVDGSLEKTKKNIVNLIKRGVNVTANCVLIPGYENDKTAMIHMLNNLGVKSVHVDHIRDVEGCAYRNDESKPIHHEPYSNLIISRKFFNNAKNGIRCLCGSMYITADGKVYPCSMERSVCYGDVTQQSLTEIISNENTTMIWKLTHDDIADCEVCEFRYCCVDCRARASVRGDIYNKDPDCGYDPREGMYD